MHLYLFPNSYRRSIIGHPRGSVSTGGDYQKLAKQVLDDLLVRRDEIATSNVLEN